MSGLLYPHHVLPVVQMEYQNAFDSVIGEAITRAYDGQVAALALNIHQNHWISVLFSFNNQILQVTIQDSLGGSIQSHQNIVNFVSQIQDLAPTANIIDVSLRQQTNGYDCGVWTVGNLVELARHASAGNLPNTQEGIGNMLRRAGMYPDEMRREHHTIAPTVRLSETDEREGYTSEESVYSDYNSNDVFLDIVAEYSDNEGSITSTTDVEIPNNKRKAHHDIDNTASLSDGELSGKTSGDSSYSDDEHRGKLPCRREFEDSDNEPTYEPQQNATTYYNSPSSQLGNDRVGVAGLVFSFDFLSDISTDLFNS